MKYLGIDMAPRRSEYHRSASRPRGISRSRYSGRCVTTPGRYSDDYDNILNSPEFRINSYSSWRSAIKIVRKRMSILSLIVYFLIVRYFAGSFPQGLFKASFLYGENLESVGSRVVFTIQQHIWTVLSLLWEERCEDEAWSKMVHTLALLLNSLVLTVLISEASMKYISAIIITSAIFTLSGQFVESLAWRYFFRCPRKIVNWIMFLVCIKMATNTKALTGFS